MSHSRWNRNSNFGSGNLKSGFRHVVVVVILVIKYTGPAVEAPYTYASACEHNANVRSMATVIGPVNRNDVPPRHMAEFAGPADQAPTTSRVVVSTCMKLEVETCLERSPLDMCQSIVFVSEQQVRTKWESVTAALTG